MPYPPPPYDDATCGRAVCGAAVCGKWWAYPTRGTLTLNGRPVASVVIGTVVGAGRGVLNFVGRNPNVNVVSQITIGRGVMTLSGRAITYRTSSTLAIGRGALLLSGRTADWVGQQWLWGEVCTDITLVAAQCTDVTMAPLTTR